MTTEQEERLLRALAWMCVQYIGDVKDGEYVPLDHQCISAGEDAVELLIEHGLIEPDARGGRWTAKGRSLLDRI